MKMRISLEYNKAWFSKKAEKVQVQLIWNKWRPIDASERIVLNQGKIGIAEKIIFNK